jgi:hypothetical protein
MTRDGRPTTLGPASIVVLLPFIIFVFPLLGTFLALAAFARAIRWLDHRLTLR